MIAWMIVAMMTFAGQPESSEGCINATSRALEPSAEPARDVAAAVAAECDVRKGAPAGSLAATMNGSQLQALRRLHQDSAIVFVMRLRACRRTPGCVLSNVR